MNNMKKLVYKLPHKLMTTQDPEKLRNNKKTLKLGGDVAQCSVNFGNSGQKYAKANINVFWSYPNLLDFITLFQVFCQVLFIQAYFGKF